MDPEQKIEQPTPVVSAPVSGSTPVDFHGRPLQKINPKQALITGQHVANVHGQFLWQLVGFSHEGVRVQEQIHGGVSDYKWETFYAHFYVRGEEPAAKLTQ